MRMKQQGPGDKRKRDTHKDNQNNDIKEIKE